MQIAEKNEVKDSSCLLKYVNCSISKIEELILLDYDIAIWYVFYDLCKVRYFE